MTLINAMMTPSLARAVTQPAPLETDSHVPGVPGDTGDFWSLWGQCQDDLMSHHCMRWMDGNHADAEDALSEASLRAYQAWSSKAAELRNFKGWFVRLVQNHCNNVRKAHTRRTRVVQCVEDIAAVAGESVADEDATAPEDAVLRREMDQYIRDAIEELPDRLKRPATLYFLQDVASPDIAAHLNLSPANVRKCIQQARALLRRRISAYLDGQAPQAKPFGLPPAARLAGNGI